MVLVSSNSLGLNLFAYCNNNPMMFFDSYGYLRVRIEIVATIIEFLIWTLLPHLLTAFNSTKLVMWAKASKWFNGIYEKASKALAKLIYNAMDRILYNIAGKAANAATRAFSLSQLERLIGGIFNFSLGYGIAWIIDHFDKDKKSGYICF